MPSPALKEQAVVDILSGKSMGQMIDAMFELREQKRKLNAEIDELDVQYAKYEDALIAKLQKEDTDKAAGKKASCSLTSSVVGNVTDWDALNKYIKRTGHFHLYQRRLSDPAVRELFEQKGKVPGVEPFTKLRLNLRVI